ncbi:hypothetical protein Tco_1364276 [Tanacetum coccineum]
MYPPTTSESSAGDSSFESSAGLSHKRCRSYAAIVTSYIHATRALVPSRADLLPPRKRFRDSISPEDSVEEDVDTDVLEDIKVDAMVDKVAVDRDVEAGVDASIGMEVDVGVDVEDEVRAERVGGEELIDGGERASLLEQVASLERSNARLRGTMMMERARADRFRRFRTMTITRSGMTPEAIEELVNRCVEEALAAHKATRAANALEVENQSQNGSDSDNGNGGNRDGENENGRNGNPNENGRGDRPVAR